MADTTINNTSIKKLPNSISGDGSTFVAKLKNALNDFSADVTKAIDEGATKPLQCNTITLSEQHSTDSLGYPQNNIYVSWLTTGIDNYKGAQIWYRKGNSGSFTYAGISNVTSYTLQGVEGANTYYVKVVTIGDNEATADFDAAPTESILIVGEVITPSLPDQFTVTWVGGKPDWKWTSVNSQDYFDYYELREDTNTGQYAGLLDVTQSLSSDVEPSNRAGNVYLYVRNIFGTYSLPFTKQYSNPTPAKPTAPTSEQLLLGISVTGDLIPTDSSGIEWNFTDNATQEVQSYTSSINTFSFYAASGTFIIKYRFYDSMGSGEWSDTITVTIKAQVDSALIADNAVTANKIKANAITADKIEANAVTAEKIEAGAVTADKIGANAVTAEKILAGAIITEKLAAGSVTAQKLAAEQITLSNALTIVGGATKLSSEGLRLTNTDNAYTLFNAAGITYYDSSGIAYAQVQKMVMGTAYDGQYIHFNAAWKNPPSVMLSPSSLTINTTAYSNKNISIICQPSEISTTGFRINCYSQLDTGSYGEIALNYSGAFSNGSNHFSAATDVGHRSWQITGVTSTGFSVPTTATTISASCTVTANIPAITEYISSSETTFTFKQNMSILVQLLNSSGTVIASNSVSMIGEGYSGSITFTLSGSMSNNSYVTIKSTLYLNVDDGNYQIAATQWSDYDSSDTINRANYLIFSYGSHFDATIPSNATITVSIPAVVVNASTNSKIAQGYANFIATDGSGNVYSITS